MSEFRKPSIMDEITPLQGQAFLMENEAIHLDKEGSNIGAHYYREAAQGLRKQDLQEKISILFDKSDAQNAILDGIAEAKKNGNVIPVFEAVGAK